MSDEMEGGGEDERGGKIYDHPEFNGKSLLELIAAMQDARVELDAAKEKKSTAQKKYDYLTMRAVPAAMGWAEEDIAKRVAKIRPEGLRGVTIYDKYFTSVLAQNRDPLKDWLRANKCGDLIQETVNGSTLKAYITDCIKKGTVYPAALVNVAIVPTAKFY